MQLFRPVLVIPFCFLFLLIQMPGWAQKAKQPFPWPDGKKMALSLSFDDGRASQADIGIPFLNQYGVKATFVVVPSSAEKRLEGWKMAVATGHEIGNHSLTHPCSGNFPWSQERALEDFTLEEMRKNLTEANAEIERMLGVKPTVYAYPCGATFVGRGKETKSFVPLIADMFLAGRLWLSEYTNNPNFCDFAQLMGVEMDRKDFSQILPMIQNAQKEGAWLILAGHEMGDVDRNQTTRLSMLKDLIEYAQDPKNGIWIAPMGTVAQYVKDHRKLR